MTRRQFILRNNHIKVWQTIETNIRRHFSERFIDLNVMKLNAVTDSAAGDGHSGNAGDGGHLMRGGQGLHEPNIYNFLEIEAFFLFIHISFEKIPKFCIPKWA